MKMRMSFRKRKFISFSEVLSLKFVPSKNSYLSMSLLVLKPVMTFYQIQNKVPTPRTGPQNPPDLAPSYIFNPSSLYYKL